MRHSRKAAPRPPFHARPVPPIKLARMRLRTFRPDSSVDRYSHRSLDVVVFLTVPRVDALSDYEKWEEQNAR